MNTAANKSISSRTAAHPTPSAQPAKSRSARPRQQFSTLKLALAAGGIAATLLGTQLIAAQDNTAAQQTPALAASVDSSIGQPLALQPTTPRQLFAQPSGNGSSIGSGRQLTNQSPFFNSAPRQMFRPLTRSRSSR